LIGEFWCCVHKKDDSNNSSDMISFINLQVFIFVMVTLIDIANEGILYDAKITPDEFLEAMNISKSNIPDLYFRVCQRIPDLSTIVKENFSKINNIIFEHLFGNKMNLVFYENIYIQTKIVPKNVFNHKTTYIDINYGGLKKGEYEQLARFVNYKDKNINGDLFLNYDDSVRLLVFNDGCCENKKTLYYRHKLKDLFLEKLK